MRSFARVAFAATIALAARAGAAPLDLVECVRTAMVHNPEIQDAADATVSAVLGREVPLAAYRFQLVPNVSGGLQGGNNTNQRYDLELSRKLLLTGTKVDVSGGTSIFSSVPQTTVPYLTQTRVTVSQPLWQGRTRLENRERIDDAERRVESARHAFEDARSDLILQVTKGFYQVVRAEELVAVANGALGRVAKLGEIARAKLGIGAVSKMDVFRAELHSARLRNALIEQQAARESAIDELRGLLGLAPDVPFEIDAKGAGVHRGPPGVDLDPAPGLGTADLVDEALGRRIELVEARRQVADAERKALLAHYKIWPAVSLVGSYARLGSGNNFEDSSRLSRTEWLLGLSSSTPLDRTEERVAASQAEIALRTVERRLRVARERVIRDVRDAWRNLERARAARVLAGEIVDQTVQQAELARFRYDKGVTDNFDLVQAETAFAEAESGRVLAAIEQVLAAAALRRSAGTLGDAFGVTPVGVTSDGLEQ